MTPGMRLQRALVVFSLSVAASSVWAGQDVPFDVQVPMFLKALSFDLNLKTRASGAIRITIVFDPANESSRGTKERILAKSQELTRLEVNGKQVVFTSIAYETREEFVSRLEETATHYLYVAPLSPDDLAAVARYSQEADLLTLASLASDVENGLVVGMEVQQGRPQFIINLTAAKQAGASFHSGFLRLCRIVGR